MVGCRLALGSDPARPRFRSREILHARRLVARRACQRLGLCPDATGDFCSPGSEVVGNLYLDRGKLKPDHLGPKDFIEATRPPAGLAAENHL